MAGLALPTGCETQVFLQKVVTDQISFLDWCNSQVVWAMGSGIVLVAYRWAVSFMVATRRVFDHGLFLSLEMDV